MTLLLLSFSCLVQIESYSRAVCCSVHYRLGRRGGGEQDGRDREEG